MIIQRHSSQYNSKQESNSRKLVDEVKLIEQLFTALELKKAKVLFALKIIQWNSFSCGIKRGKN